MLLIEFAGVIVLWFFVVAVKQLYADANDRHDKQIMAVYRQQEEARVHASNLAAIDRTVRATAAEMVRVAAEDRGEPIEGTAVEVER
jgi:hypothetical protein